MKVTRWQDGDNVTLADDIPVVGGTLTMDSGDPVRHHVSLEIGPGEDWVPDDKDSPVTPFGQFCHLFVRLDYADNTMSPWFKVFEGPIQSNSYERPSRISTIEAADASQTVDDFAYLRKRSYTKGRTLKAVLKEIVDDCLPGAIYGIDASTQSENIHLSKPFVVEAGTSRLEAANLLAGKHQQEIFFSGLGDLVIRKDLSDEDDDHWDSSEPGPDIGYVSNPICIFRDGLGGNLVGTTTTLTREGSVNGVAVNVSATVNRKRKGQKKAQSKELWYTAWEDAKGSVAFGDSFGRLPYVETKSVDKLTDEVKDDADQRAKRLLQRRRGMIRYLDFDALPQYFLEPDDRVKITVDGVTEYHFVQSVEIPLDGGPMRCRTRTLSVTDPGNPEDPEGWVTGGLPSVVKVMNKDSYTITEDFAPTLDDYSDHSSAELGYGIGSAVGNYGVPYKYDNGDVWDCAWRHAWEGERDSVKWNCPPTEAIYTGAGCCADFTGTVTGGFGGASVAQVPGWYATTYESGGLNSVGVTSCSLSSWMDYPHVKAAHLDPLGPSAGNPVPTPPPGFTLEWEDTTNTVVKIEAAINESISKVATNKGRMYARKMDAAYGSEFGPNTAPGASPFEWAAGGCQPGGAFLPGFDGGAGPWRDVTDLIETTKKTWWIWISDILHDRARHWGVGRIPGDFIGEFRDDLQIAFRFTIKPSRYRFVPTSGGG